jgi:hypothetical protein
LSEESLVIGSYRYDDTQSVVLTAEFRTRLTTNSQFREEVARSQLRWELPDFDPDFDPGFEREESQQRDPVVDQAKESIRAFFDEERTNVFYKQQLEVIFEDEYFHWVTSRALSELAARGTSRWNVKFYPVQGTSRFTTRQHIAIGADRRRKSSLWFRGFLIRRSRLD